MTFDGRRSPPRRNRPDLPALAGLGLLACGALPAPAQEPLFLRIRPLPEPVAAQAERAALWARRDAHARAVIASVCTGCLGTWTPPAAPPDPPPAPAADRIATLAEPAGLETDPGSGASRPDPEPPDPERLP